MNRIKILELCTVMFVMVTMISCIDKEECCTIIDVDVQIHYQKESGENLIDSSDEFKQSNIKIYYKNGDEFEYFINGNLDYPNMHYLYEDADLKKILTVFPSNYYEGNHSTTLIELNETHIDTLLCEFELDSNREICKRAWLNGVEMVGRYIEVKK